MITALVLVYLGAGLVHFCLRYQPYELVTVREVFIVVFGWPIELVVYWWKVLK